MCFWWTRQMHLLEISPRYGDGILVLLKLGCEATCSKEDTFLGFLRCLKADVFFFSSECFGRWVAWGFGAVSFISGVFVVFVAHAFESLHFSSGCSRSRRWSTGSRWIGLLQWPRQERERGSKQIWKEHGGGTWKNPNNWTAFKFYSIFIPLCRISFNIQFHLDVFGPASCGSSVSRHSSGNAGRCRAHGGFPGGDLQDLQGRSIENAMNKSATAIQIYASRQDIPLASPKIIPNLNSY